MVVKCKWLTKFFPKTKPLHIWCDINMSHTGSKTEPENVVTDINKSLGGIIQFRTNFG